MRLQLAVAFSFTLLCTSASNAASVLYGGNGGHVNVDQTPLSINDGSLVTIDQSTGAVTLVGHPAGVARLSGIVFAGPDLLYGSTLGGGGFPGFPPQPNRSRLIQINPDTGGLVSNIGPITDGAGGPGIAIADLAIQPGTGALYGIQAVDAEGGAKPGQPIGNLYMIDRNSGVGTLVGETGVSNASLAFAPDGHLYLTSANAVPGVGLTDLKLSTVDPATGKILTSVPTATFYAALTFHDGVLFAGTGSGDSGLSGDIFTIDPATGKQVMHVSTTGVNFVGDLDFRPVPEPLSLTMAGLGLLSILSSYAVRRRRSRLGSRS
jgi:PEP-CTERM motif